MHIREKVEAGCLQRFDEETRDMILNWKILTTDTTAKYVSITLFKKLGIHLDGIQEYDLDGTTCISLRTAKEILNGTREVEYDKPNLETEKIKNKKPDYISFKEFKIAMNFSPVYTPEYIQEILDFSDNYFERINSKIIHVFKSFLNKDDNRLKPKYVANNQRKFKKLYPELEITDYIQKGKQGSQKYTKQMLVDNLGLKQTSIDGILALDTVPDDFFIGNSVNPKYHNNKYELPKNIDLSPLKKITEETIKETHVSLNVAREASDIPDNYYHGVGWLIKKFNLTEEDFLKGGGNFYVKKSVLDENNAFVKPEKPEKGQKKYTKKMLVDNLGLKKLTTINDVLSLDTVPKDFFIGEGKWKEINPIYYGDKYKLTIDIDFSDLMPRERGRKVKQDDYASWTIKTSDILNAVGLKPTHGPEVIMSTFYLPDDAYHGGVWNPKYFINNIPKKEFVAKGEMWFNKLYPGEDMKDNLAYSQAQGIEGNFEPTDTKSRKKPVISSYTTSGSIIKRLTKATDNAELVELINSIIIKKGITPADLGLDSSDTSVWTKEIETLKAQLLSFQKLSKTSEGEEIILLNELLIDAKFELTTYERKRTIMSERHKREKENYEVVIEELKELLSYKSKQVMNDRQENEYKAKIKRLTNKITSLRMDLEAEKEKPTHVTRIEIGDISDSDATNFHNMLMEKALDYKFITARWETHNKKQVFVVSTPDGNNDRIIHYTSEELGKKKKELVYEDIYSKRIINKVTNIVNMIQLYNDSDETVWKDIPLAKIDFQKRIAEKKIKPGKWQEQITFLEKFLFDSKEGNALITYGGNGMKANLTIINSITNKFKYNAQKDLMNMIETYFVKTDKQ